MNISLVPLDIYKIPKHCSDVLVAQNFLYTVQHIVTGTEDNTQETSHAVGVVSGNFSNLNICEEAVILFEFTTHVQPQVNIPKISTGFRRIVIHWILPPDGRTGGRYSSCRAD